MFLTVVVSVPDIYIDIDIFTLFLFMLLPGDTRANYLLAFTDRGSRLVRS